MLGIEIRVTMSGMASIIQLNLKILILNCKRLWQTGQSMWQED